MSRSWEVCGGNWRVCDGDETPRSDCANRVRFTLGERADVEAEAEADESEIGPTIRGAAGPSGLDSLPKRYPHPSSRSSFGLRDRFPVEGVVAGSELDSIFSKAP